MSNCLIIAELGINHNGDADLAGRMLRAAVDAGADVVKFHTYKADQVMTAETPLADYMKEGESDDSFLDMARRFELTTSNMLQLKDVAERAGVEFLSSPFDVPSVRDLVDLGVKRLKIPSGELVNPLLMQACAETGLPLIVSTGMADMAEVEWAMDFLARHNSGPVALLHCLSQYPGEFRYVNLNAIPTLIERFDCPIGFSDHTPGIEAAVAAVALGATLIEKHFTLDRDLPGPDQAASLVPDEFRAMVQAIRNVEDALGSGVKEPAPPEIVNRGIVRKSIVAAQDLEAGSVLTLDMLTTKRPGTGIPAIRIDELIGRRLRRGVRADALLREDDLE